MRVLVAKGNASQRTKNRVKENGPRFELKRGKSVFISDIGEACLFESEKTGWYGWLPVDEITMSGECF